MANSSLRPRRGKRSTAISKGIVLKRGEIFFEVPDSGVGTGAGKIVMGDGTSAYEDLPYFNEGGSGAGTVQSVNHVTPDQSGNVTLTQVPYAENLLADDNIESTAAYIFRTSGGESDIESGAADLDRIKGNCIVEEGSISIATPTSFRSIGINQFDKASAIIEGYTVSSSGTVTASAGSYVCYIHAIGGLDNGYTAYDPNNTITRIGWLATIPTTSTTGIYVTPDGNKVTAITNDPTTSYISAVEDGYICVACTNIDDLCVHPTWSGSADEETGAYNAAVIVIPTKDADNNNLPTASYGFPSVNDVRDEINFAQKTYTQRIGHYAYSAANLATVEAMGVDYIYDGTHIFYVLPNPIVYRLASTVSSSYAVHDFGTEEFIGTSVPVYGTTVYGENLKDKLRRDVVTISPMNLTARQKSTVRTNIDAAQDHLVFTEAEDTDNQTLLNTIVSGNPMNTLFGASKRLLRRLDAQANSKVASVNNTFPDKNGNVELTRVPLADNLYSPDNNENYEDYIYRTSGGSSDLSSGAAQLSFIRGHMSVKGRVPESLEASYSSSYTPDPDPEEGSEEEYEYPNVQIDAATWRNCPLGSASGTYVFTYNGTNWTYNSSSVDLATYGMEVTGTVKNTDTITVVYVKANQGILCTIKPTSFVSIELNQFNSTDVLSGYTINSSGVITAQSGSYVAFCKAPYSNEEGYIAYDSNGTMTRMGFSTVVPTAGATVALTGQALGSSISTYVVPETSYGYNVGYVCVACTDISKLCIHPRWSGGEDTAYAAYTSSVITIPTTDANSNNLPYVSYGLPQVGSIADEINFDLKQYIQRIGHYAYSTANLETVKALGVDYEYDLSHIFYVLSAPITWNLDSSVSGTYQVNDYGTEHFEYTIGIGEANDVLVYADHLYGQNLRDKLRRDVLTISAQSLSSAEQTQVLTNIGAASAASVTQLNNDLYGNGFNKNNLYTGRYLGEMTGSNIDSIISTHGISTGKFDGLGLGDYWLIKDGTHNSYWMIAGFNHFNNKGGNWALGNHITLIPREFLNKPQISTDNLCPMNSTNTTGVSKNTNNPFYNITQGEETAGYQAYWGSDMCQIYLPTIAANLQQVLGSHLKKTDYLLPNTMDMSSISKNGWKGFPTNWNWVNTNNSGGFAILPTEIEIYGSLIWSNGNYDVGINCQKLPVFNYISYNTFFRAHFWLRSVVSSSGFAVAASYGHASSDGASARRCVHPLINIG